MVGHGRHTEVDPLWLAVFFMVMALALDNRPATLTDPSHPFHGYSHKQLGDLTNKYHAVAVRALHLGNCMATPRVRTIQYVRPINLHIMS